MARNKVQNIRSNQVSTVDGSPKLPTSEQIEYGELAVNYAKGKETISLKNSENEIIALSMYAEQNKINDVKVNNLSVINSDKIAYITIPTKVSEIENDKHFISINDSYYEGIKDDIHELELDVSQIEGRLNNVEDNKQDVIDDIDSIRSGAEAGATAIQNVKTINEQDIVGEGNVTLEGTDIVINTDYEQVDFDESFKSKLENGVVTAGDTIQEGIHKVEEEVSTLTDVVLDNEIVVSETVNNIANAVGIVNNEGVIGYQQKTDAYCINNATSVHDATVILDTKVKELSDNIISDVTDANETSMYVRRRAYRSTELEWSEGIHILKHTAYVLANQDCLSEIVELRNAYSTEELSPAFYTKDMIPFSIDTWGSTFTAHFLWDNFLYKVMVNPENTVYSVESVDIQNTVKRLDRLELLMSGEVVDLGLPSGTLWAKCNLGATKETDFGKYYQFGALEGYKDSQALAHSTWATAPFNNGSSTYDETYFKENKSKWFVSERLKPEYDAAYTESNGKLRIPTSVQFDELFENTDAVFETNFAGTGVAGTKLMNRKDATKYIFIPKGGYYREGEFNETASDLWTSSLVPEGYPSGSGNESAFNAYGMTIINSFEPTARYEAAAIRPVYTIHGN